LSASGAVRTRAAAQELRLKRGDDAIGIIKSTEVMIAREAPAPPGRRARRR
jgi:molybdopterin-binding protein